jgi:hypothetical protein
VTDVPDWTQSVNIQNAEIPVAGGVTIDAGQSGIGVFVGSLDYPQLVNSSFELSEGVAVYTETVPLANTTTSIGVVVFPAIPPNFAVGTTITVSVVGGITGVVYADEVQLQQGEGAQVTVAISGALEVGAVVTVTYSTPALSSAVHCFFIGTFGPPGSLVTPNVPAPPTAGWVNVQQLNAVNILKGTASADGATIITVPANRIWQGTLSITFYATLTGLADAYISSSQPELAVFSGLAGAPAFGSVSGIYIYGGSGGQAVTFHAAPNASYPNGIANGMLIA